MISFIGGGKMGLALVKAFTKATDHDEVSIVERDEKTRRVVQQWIDGSHVQRVKVADAPVAAYGAVIAVKPKDVEIAVNDAVNAGAKRVLSIAAGIPVAKLHEWAGPGIPVLRAMPNIGALVGGSATALCVGPMTHEEDVQWAEAVLSTAGTVVRVNEAQMDAVTGLAGSGPAYVFLVAESMIDAGVQAGLPIDIAKELALSTLLGASRVLTEPDALSANELRSLVTTPAGTTAAGLRVLEQRAVRAAIIDAVGAAAERSHQLGAQ
jgi:pyrroline-5-carboxylate reductase